MSAASRVTVAVTGAATTIFVARLLGPSGTGAFAVAITLIYMLTAMTTLGVEHGVAYYVASKRWGAGDARRAAQRLAAAIGVAAAAVAVGVRLVAPDAFGGLSVAETAVIVAALPFSLSWFYIAYIALSIDRYEAFVLPPAAQSAFAMALVVALGALTGLPGTVVGLSVSHVAVATVLTWWAMRNVTGGEGDGEPRQLRRAIRFGIKGYSANALQLLNYRLDVFILSAAAGAAAVGQLSVAIAVTSVMWLLPMALSDVLFPRIASLSTGVEGHETRAFVEAKSLRHAAVVVTVASLVLAGALLALVVPVYGSDFRPAVDLGLILLPGVALIGLVQIMSATIVGRGKPIYSLYAALIVTPVTVALYVLLIPALDAQGAALAKTASYGLSFLLVLFFYRRTTGHGGPASFLPTRSELADYQALPRAIRAWAAGLRA